MFEVGKVMLLLTCLGLAVSEEYMSKEDPYWSNEDPYSKEDPNLSNEEWNITALEMESDVFTCLETNIQAEWPDFDETDAAPDDPMASMNWALDAMVGVMENVCQTKPVWMPCLRETSTKSEKHVDKAIFKMMIPNNIDAILSYACTQIKLIQQHAMCTLMSGTIMALDPRSCIHTMTHDLAMSLNIPDPNPYDYDFKDYSSGQWSGDYPYPNYPDHDKDYTDYKHYDDSNSTDPQASGLYQDGNSTNGNDTEYQHDQNNTQHDQNDTGTHTTPTYPHDYDDDHHVGIDPLEFFTDQQISLICTNMKPIPDCLVQMANKCDSGFSKMVQTLGTMVTEACGNSATVRAGVAGIQPRKLSVVSIFVMILSRILNP